MLLNALLLTAALAANPGSPSSVLGPVAETANTEAAPADGAPFLAPVAGSVEPLCMAPPVLLDVLLPAPESVPSVCNAGPPPPIPEKAHEKSKNKDSSKVPKNK
jgi:hypothetical protein